MMKCGGSFFIVFYRGIQNRGSGIVTWAGKETLDTATALPPGAVLIVF